MDLRLFICLMILPFSGFCIECYTGLKLLSGTSVGTATIRCDNSAAYCYNISATANAFLDVTKAGCSMWRCMFAQNKCISTTFQKIPISLCCCNSNLCNVGENNNSFQQQKIGGLNAQPEAHEGLSREEVERRFEEDVDNDVTTPTTRPSRFSPTEPTQPIEWTRT
ncbi:unnamed protein product [Caenorhabditis auriculariae]|uniref:UPAR/Ly6 domain-containing protein n=1 Tax=Caenorhabditis auriculariae TaxID=2777116 RepID=A0A8S1GNX3_9PELO|nr:unnamed protein product [Caenorhabditis auriculariae]